MNSNDSAPPAYPAAAAAKILQVAAERGRASATPYAGVVTPAEAWELVQEVGARLVDVRTAAELKYVGRVPGAVHIEWSSSDPAGPAHFVETLRGLARPDDVVLMLCRSGARSHAAAAAATAAGYRSALNILEGFEGKLDENRHRGRLEGWRMRGLPWEQD
ncbi:MAG TPA: rhodanese-like domain-containing protein [Burkholderiaceae bacterium]|nr:rhodanese-like domain-containing protein [Burkholderiaceae bacterium]